MFQTAREIPNKTFEHVPVSLGYDDLKTFENPGCRLYETPGGRRYPSVTSMLGSSADKQWLTEWEDRIGKREASRISSYAAKRGTAVHDMCENYLSNRPWRSGRKFNEIGSFLGIKSFLDRIDRVHALEVPLYSDKLKLAGRVDCIAEFDGVLSVIDFKTANNKKRQNWIGDYWLQTTTYSLMFEELTGFQIEQLVIIIAVDSAPGQVFIDKRAKYFPELKSRIQKFREVHYGD